MRAPHCYHVTTGKLLVVTLVVTAGILMWQGFKGSFLIYVTTVTTKSRYTL